MPETGRRSFVLGVLGAVGTLIALGYAFVAERFMLPPPESASTLQKVGTSQDFQPGDVKLVVYTGDGGFPDGVYMVRVPGSSALAAYDEHCAHLQCPVQWVAGTQTFDCPCHGSVYSIQGTNIAGPAPHPLNYHTVVEQNGEVYVGGIVPWGTPQWQALAVKWGTTGAWVPGAVPGTIRFSSKA